jgi:hypothetical protein
MKLAQILIILVLVVSMSGRAEEEKYKATGAVNE